MWCDYGIEVGAERPERNASVTGGLEDRMSVVYYRLLKRVWKI
jgi:hypothetical protein